MRREHEHTRLGLLHTKAKALCLNGHGIQPVRDAFEHNNGLILELECRCRRAERA